MNVYFWLTIGFIATCVVILIVSVIKFIKGMRK